MPSRVSELCLLCGLCCDGSLFRQVEVTGEEARRVEALAMRTGEKRGKRWMWLPCGKLEATCCTVYEARPGGCQRFFCELARKLEAGAVGFDEARAVVNEVHARVAELRVRLPPPIDEPVVQFARRALGAPEVRVSSEAIAALRAVDVLLREHFVRPVGRGS